MKENNKKNRLVCKILSIYLFPSIYYFLEKILYIFTSEFFTMSGNTFMPSSTSTSTQVITSTVSELNEKKNASANNVFDVSSHSSSSTLKPGPIIVKPPIKNRIIDSTSNSKIK